MLGWDELSYDQSQEARGLRWKPRVRLRKSDEQSRMHECKIKDRSNEIWERRCERFGGGCLSWVEGDG